MPAQYTNIPTGRVALLGQGTAGPVAPKVTAEGQLNTLHLANTTNTRDSTSNDNDKTFTVGAGKIWIVHWVTVAFTSNSEVGNRRIELQVRDASDNVLLWLPSTEIQAASATERHNWINSGAMDRGQIGSNHITSIPNPLVLTAGQDIRVFDGNDVDPGDDMEVYLVFEEIDL